MAHEVLYARNPRNYMQAFCDWMEANGFTPKECKASNPYISDDGKTITALQFKFDEDGRKIFSELALCPECGQRLSGEEQEEAHALGAVTFALTKELVADPKDYNLIVNPLPDGARAPRGTIALVV